MSRLYGANSLVRQLVFRLFLVSGCALLVSGAMLWWQFNHASNVVIDRGLGSTLEKIEAGVRINGEGRPYLSLPAEFLKSFNGDLFFTISDVHGTAFLSLPEGRTHTYHPFEPDANFESQYFEHNYLHSGENYLGITKRMLIGEREFWIQVVEEVPEWRSFVHYSIEIFLHGAGVLILLHFVGSVLLAQATIRASFEPVAKAAEAARSIVPGRSTTRISDPALPAEIRPLAEAIDLALDRLDAALAAQKRFTADAAHELLTPVAVMKARVESLSDRSLAAGLHEDVEEMATLVEQLLELSELEAEGAIEGGWADLHAIAIEVLGKLAPLAIRKGIEPELTGASGPIIVRGCTKILSRALSNLIQNAILHARGASRIEVRVGPGRRMAVIDDGPGVPVNQRQAIFERFHRAPGTKGGGTGLGLAIVRRIVEAHGGQITVHDGLNGRGVAFEIELPE